MNVLVIGGGGREHAIVRALKASPLTEKLYCAPGNGGIAALAQCVPIPACDVPAAVKFALEANIGLVVVAPDDPLALGMVDALQAAGIRAFGPTKSAAEIESSKAFAKGLMRDFGIPTAGYAVFDDAERAAAYIREKGAPIVVKADGLALGKGVVVAQTVSEAEDAVRTMMSGGKFGDAGKTVVIEEFMTGPEVSVLCFTDGAAISPMPPTQDHKRVFDGDLGPNTGGMGAFCPSPRYTPEIAGYCMENIFKPTVKAMNQIGRTFKGVLYFGLMLTPDGPRVVEYNARFGDPETQPVLSLLETDLLEIFGAVIDTRLSQLDIKWKTGAACCVCMASSGYPGKYETGYEIAGLESVSRDVFVYHSGTKLLPETGRLVTSGGRVLGVTATGGSLESAVSRAYEGVSAISFEGAHYRTDIGRR